MHSLHDTDSHLDRASYLEEVNRASIQALQLVLEMGRQGVSLNRIDNPQIILKEIQDKVSQLIPWKASAFYLMDEQSADLTMTLCTPNEAAEEMNAIFEHLVEDRSLSLVLRRSNHFFVGVDNTEVLTTTATLPFPSSDQDVQPRSTRGARGKIINILQNIFPVPPVIPVVKSSARSADAQKCRCSVTHAMNTVSRCRGVFVGIPKQPRKSISDVALAIFSIMMQSTAQTLESYELYRLIRGVNTDLKDKVQHLESEMTERKRVQRRLFESQQMLQLVMDTIPQGVFWKDSRSAYLGCNRNYAYLVELDKPEDIVGKSDYDLSWRSEGSAKHRNTDLRVMRDGRACTGLTERVVRSDGVAVWVEASIVPLKDVEGHTIGVMGCVQDITERIRYQERLAHMAMHDPLTGLPNRALLIERMERAIERGRRRKNYNFAVLMLDLDRFKQINDTMGHQFGDTILGLIARRIGKCLRGMDTVARLGGDEFAVLLEELSSPREAIVITRRLLKEIGQPEIVEGSEVFITASGGLLVKTRPYHKADDLMRDVEIAMHSAVERGGAKFRVFTPSMLHRALYTASVEYELRRGLLHGDLFVQYQPIYALDQGCLIGFEALARWNHPERGLVSPAEFIPIAERTGIIHDLGNWVLRSACRAMAQWQAQFPQAAALFLSVNLSGCQLSDPNLTDSIREVLKETGLPATSLKLEITESAIMENADLALITLRQLKSLGISLAIDDFGTGYSSLAYLQRFPVDTLKIDRSFISGLNNHDGPLVSQH